MKEDRHIIWSNYDLDYEDWRDDLEAEYPELTEDQRIALMYEINGDYLDDERVNLNIQLSQPILVIGDLGLWYGRRSGYKEIESGNIRDCLYADTDYSTEAQLENVKVQLENAKAEVEKPFPQEEELQQKTARLNELNIKLNMDKRENEIVDGDRDEDEKSLTDRKKEDRNECR